MTAIDLSHFHFLRPLWFWGVVPLVMLLYLLSRRHLSSRSWRAVVDQRLLPYLLLGKDVKSGPASLLAVGLAGLLAIVALAGPAWQQLEKPVFRQQSALVILLDLSRSMDAADIRPSRLQRARLKLLDILKKRREGQTALIAYAATAYVVTPLTSDSKTIAAQLPSLSTDLMPAQGSRPDRALELATDLLSQAGVSRGSVLLVTDGVDGVDNKALQKAVSALTAAGHRLLVLGVGTAGGAPIAKSSGGFVTDDNGAIVIPKLDATALRSLASEGGGIYRDLRIDDSDINALLAIVDADKQLQLTQKTDDMMSDQWRDDGVWLVLPLLVLAAFSFRRGVLSALLAIVILLPHSDPVMAMDWDSLWRNDDQRGSQALEQGQAGQAAELFHDPGWRAAAQYRAGKYEDALKTLESQDGAEAAYNRGNALTQLHRLPEALKAYEEALKLAPDNADARHNRDLVKKALEQQQQNAGDKQNQEQNNDRQGQSQQNDKQQQGQDQQQSGQQQSGQQSSGQNSSGQNSSNQNTSGQQSSGQQQGTQQPSAGQRNDDTADAKANSSAAADSQPAAQDKDRAGQADKSTEPETAQKDDSTASQQPQQKSADQVEPQQPASTDQSVTESEQQQATEQWLRRIPDDPGGLWRRKFLYQYQRQQHQGDEKQPW